MSNKTRKKPFWDNCVFASFEALQDCANGNFRDFVWPDEGVFTKTGSFRFNKEHQREFEPLAIDKISADMLLALHKALPDDKKTTFEEWIAKDRAHFAWTWEFTQKHVKITGFKSR